MAGGKRASGEEERVSERQKSEWRGGERVSERKSEWRAGESGEERVSGEERK